MAMTRARILVVEDERIVAKDISKRLSDLGYKVVASVSSGEAAIETAREAQPDLVLMDVQLKGQVDGIEAAEKIRLDYNIPVIYLTAYADENTLQRAKVTEPFGYIIKPFDERDLHAAIEIALRRRLAESAVRVALEKERELGELKSRFWSMVAHEFRRPMTDISASAQLLEQYSHQLPEAKRREYLYLIQEAVRSMDGLLNDVLAVSRAERGGLKFEPAALNLEQFCRHLVEEMKFTSGESHPLILTMHGQCDEVCLDKQLLRHILSNLLSNAIKYSPEGGTVYLDLTCSENRAVFQVRDTGIGIPPSDRQHLFESFYRAENVGDIPGTGLGLTMVKTCLELHGGQISVESEVGAGTTFTVILPLCNCHSVTRK
jgi:signal transduction histidine kinase